MKPEVSLLCSQNLTGSSKNTNDVFRDVVQILSRRSLISKCHTVSCYDHKCDFLYACKYRRSYVGCTGTHKCWTAICTDMLCRMYRNSQVLNSNMYRHVASDVPELTSAEQQYVQTCCVGCTGTHKCWTAICADMLCRMYRNSQVLNSSMCRHVVSDVPELTST
jgi:hypothetical protein